MHNGKCSKSGMAYTTNVFTALSHYTIGVVVVAVCIQQYS